MSIRINLAYGIRHFTPKGCFDILEDMDVVIMTPTYNEKGNVLKLLEKINTVKKNVKGFKIQELIVDGNSPDKTAEVVNNLAKKDKSVFVLIEKKKQGLGSAYLAGMDYAFGKLKADVVLILDADLSHDPKYIPKFLAKMKLGADFVVGSRYIKGGAIAKEWSIHRKALSIFGNKFTTLMLGTNKLNDWTSGFRAIGRPVYTRVAPLMRNRKEFKGYTFNMSFAYYTIGLGFKVDQVAIKFIDRTNGKSKLGLEYLYHTPIFLFKTRWKGLKNI